MSWPEPRYSCPRPPKNGVLPQLTKLLPNFSHLQLFQNFASEWKHTGEDAREKLRFVLDRSRHPWPTVPRNVGIVSLSFIRISTRVVK